MQRHGLPEIHHEVSRREFLRGVAGAGLAGAGVVLLGACGSDESKGSPTGTPGSVVDPAPETTTIRLGKDALFPSVPLYLAGEQFLPAEGFTNVQYIDVPYGSGGLQQLAADEMDIGLPFAGSVTGAVDAGDQIVILAGVHNGPFVLFGNDRVRSLRDLKGKRVFVLKRDANDPFYPFMAALLAYVGIDIEHEVEFVELTVDANGVPNAEALLSQLQAGTIDAWPATRPFSTALRNANIGHVVLNTMMDPPWSQYFGVMVTGNRDFVEQHPAATKRALRAILKAADVCAREPERAARFIVDKGYTDNYDQALDAMTGVSYAAWREFNPEDTVRFYTLRLHEAGIIKSTPDEIIRQGTDWRFFNDLRQELKDA